MRIWKPGGGTAVSSRRSSTSTRAWSGPRRQREIMSSTASAGPAKTASTDPSRRFLTQPDSSSDLAVRSIQEYHEDVKRRRSLAP